MTIIEPNKNRIQINYTLVFLALFLVSGVLFTIYLYNQTVDLRYLLKNQEKLSRELQVANADLKNELYKILDTNNFTNLAGELGLVKDNKPEYLKPRDPIANAPFN